MGGETTLTRRDLLKSGAAGVAGLLLGLPAAAQERRQRGPYGTFRMGIQSYSLRNFSLEDALAKTKQLGLAYWEAFPAHVPQTEDAAKQKELLEKHKTAGVELKAWGVVGFDGNEANTRKTLDFARAMGIEVISADPAPEAFPVLDKVLESYPGIFIAIHNHGPGHRYDKISHVADAIKGHHERIGACVDTGHFLRSGEDPVEAVKQMGARVYGVHLKDVKDQKVFTEIGKGDLKTADLLRELRRLRYNKIISLEYEEHPENPMSYIEECLAATREAVRSIRRRRGAGD